MPVPSKVKKSEVFDQAAISLHKVVKKLRKHDFTDEQIKSMFHGVLTYDGVK